MLLVSRLDLLGSSGDRRFLEVSSGAQLFQYAGALKLLFEPFQGLVNGLVVFDINNNHRTIVFLSFEEGKFSKPIFYNQAIVN
jgi:hypothetical protein